MSPIASPLRRERSLTRQVCLAIVLAAGLNIAWGFGLVWATAVIVTLMQPNGPSDQILMAADGTPVRIRRFADGRAPENTTLDGRPYPATAKTAWLQGAGLVIESPPAVSSVSSPVKPRIEGFTDGRPSPVDWFFVEFRNAQPVGYFVSYDRVSRQRVGYLGLSGFQTTEPTVEQVFPIPVIRDWGTSGLIAPFGTSNGNTPEQMYAPSVDDAPPEPSPDLPAAAHARRIPLAIHYLVSGNRTYRVDLRARTVSSVLEVPGLVQIGEITRTHEPAPMAAAPRLTPPTSGTLLDEVLVVRGKGSVIVLDASGRQESVFRLPAELADRTFDFFQMSDRTGFAMVRRNDRKTRTSATDLLWFTKEGTITRRVDGLLAGPSWRASVSRTALLIAFGVPTPLGPLGAALSLPLAVDYESQPHTYTEAVLSVIPSMAAALIVSAILVAIALWLYFRRTARYGEDRRAAWIVLITLWGLPAYFGYVLQRRWPAAIPCESCGDPVPRDRDACLHCGEEFAAPAANGLEIFA